MGHTEVALELLASGADIRGTDKVRRGVTPAWPDTVLSSEAFLYFLWRLPCVLMCRRPAFLQAGQHVLHHAILGNPQGRCVSLILERDAGIARVPAKNGYLPLHTLSSDTPVAVVAALLRAHPAATSVTASDGTLPLHAAIEDGASAEVVEALLAADASVAAHTPAGEYALLPLHFINAKTSAEVASALLRAYPGAAADEGSNGSRPLHWAIHDVASAAVVATVLAANPSAVSQSNSYGMLPLHYVRAGTPLEVVTMLLEVYPAGARAIDTDGHLPLHQAVYHGAPPEAVAAILAAHLEAVWAQNAVGDLPLGCVGPTTRPEVVQLLLAAAPETAGRMRTDGNMPLHSATAFCTNADTLCALLRANIGALALRHDDGRLKTDGVLDEECTCAAAELARRLCCGRVPSDSRVSAAQLLLGPAAEATTSSVSNALVRFAPFDGSVVCG